MENHGFAKSEIRNHTSKVESSCVQRNSRRPVRRAKYPVLAELEILLQRAVGLLRGGDVARLQLLPQLAE